MQAEALAGEEAGAFVDGLLGSPLASPVISAALTADEPLGPAALAVVHNSVAALHTPGMETLCQMLLDEVSNSRGRNSIPLRTVCWPPISSDTQVQESTQ